MVDEPTAETPGIKKYVRATIAEAHPERKIRLHEGIVTREYGKEIEVVDPQLTWVGWNNPPKPKYVTERCHKEGATRSVPPNRAGAQASNVPVPAS